MDSDVHICTTCTQMHIELSYLFISVTYIKSQHTHRYIFSYMCQMNLTEVINKYS